MRMLSAPRPHDAPANALDRRQPRSGIQPDRRLRIRLMSDAVIAGYIRDISSTRGESFLEAGPGKATLTRH
jgi:hypothetical protein